MHRVIEDGLEDYLVGSAKPDFTAHLTACDSCRQEVAAVLETSSLFAALRADEVIAPPPFFAARVVTGVQAETERRRNAANSGFWSLFSLDPTFEKRMVLASLLLLGVLGTYLVNQEQEYSNGPSIESVMATGELPAHSLPPNSSDGDRMLITLTAFEQ